MAELNTMYEGVTNSPDTFLTSALASGGTVLYVADGSVFGTLPNLAVLGSGANAETILVIDKRTDNGYNIQRAVEGLARDWPQATIAARNFTNKDYTTLIENVQALNIGKVEIVTGKGLSKNDYDDTAKDKVDAIPSNPQYTDTVYTHPTTHPASIITQDANNRFVSDTEKSTWAGKQNALSAGSNITISGNTISATDTVYTHPASHPATIITQDSNNRFVTDVEKQAWNGKQNALTAGENITIENNVISASGSSGSMTLVSQVTILNNLILRKFSNGMVNASGAIWTDQGTKVSEAPYTVKFTGVIPLDYRPLYDFSCTVLVKNTSTYREPGLLQFRTNGDVRGELTPASGYYSYFVNVWYIAS